MEMLAVLAVLDNQDSHLAINYANHAQYNLAVRVMRDQRVVSPIAAGGHARIVWEETGSAVRVVRLEGADPEC